MVTADTAGKVGPGTTAMPAIAAISPHEGRPRGPSSATSLWMCGGSAEDGRIEVSPTTAAAATWDAFAQRCGASFRCAHRATRGWQFERHVLHKLHRLDLFATVGSTRVKIGQCAVGVGRRVGLFCDALQLLPDHADRWPRAMAAVLDRLGPGRYVYGSDWSLERPRELDLAALPGVAVERVEPTAVSVIDFARWPSIDDYRRAVSTNVRRNVRRAERVYADLRVLEPVRLADVRRHLASLAIRRQMYRRKGVSRSTLAMAARSLARAGSTVPFGHAAHLTTDAGRRLLATHVGITFGPHEYYLEGAGRPHDDGASWLLLTTMIERAYARTGGRGTFVMGPDDGTRTGPAWDGLRRSRAQCAATAVPTSTVTFAFQPTVVTTDAEEDDDKFEPDADQQQVRRGDHRAEGDRGQQRVELLPQAGGGERDPPAWSTRRWA